MIINYELWITLLQHWAVLGSGTINSMFQLMSWFMRLMKYNGKRKGSLVSPKIRLLALCADGNWTRSLSFTLVVYLQLCFTHNTFYFQAFKRAGVRFWFRSFEPNNLIYTKLHDISKETTSCTEDYNQTVKLQLTERRGKSFHTMKPTRRDMINFCCSVKGGTFCLQPNKAHPHSTNMLVYCVLCVLCVCVCWVSHPAAPWSGTFRQSRLGGGRLPPRSFSWLMLFGRKGRVELPEGGGLWLWCCEFLWLATWLVFFRPPFWWEPVEREQRMGLCDAVLWTV